VAPVFPKDFRGLHQGQQLSFSLPLYTGVQEFHNGGMDCEGLKGRNGGMGGGCYEFCLWYFALPLLETVAELGPTSALARIIED